MPTEDKYPAHEALPEKYPASEGLQVQEGTGPELYCGPPQFSAGLEVATPSTLTATPPATPFSHSTGKAELESLPIPPPTNKEDRRRCGLSRKRFIFVGVAVLLVVVIAVVAGAAGAALASRNNGSANATPAPAAPPGQPTASSGPSGTSGPANASPSSGTATSSTSSPPSETSSPPSSTATSRPFSAPPGGVLSLDCPALNGTQYKPPASAKPYLVLCRTDFDPRGGNVGLFLLPTLHECIDSCTAANNGCDAVTFAANVTEFNTANCFLHRKSGKPVPTKMTLQAGAMLLD